MYIRTLNKNEIRPLAAIWMHLEIIILREVRKKQTPMRLLICKIFFKKMIQMNLFTKQKQTHRLREQTYGSQGVKVVGTDLQIGMDMYTLLYLK